MWAAIGRLFLKLGSWSFSHREEVITVVTAIVEAKKKKEQ